MDENIEPVVDDVPEIAVPEEPRSAPPRQQQGEGSDERPSGGRRRFIAHAKVCAFCVEKVTHIDYKSYDMLRRYLSDRAKIRPRRQTGTCARHQRALARAIKRARHLALLPFVGMQSREN